jgi:thymidylate synthase (FAD)
MKIISPSVELVKPTGSILKDIELVGRVSYKSENKIQEGSSIDFVKRMVKSGHWAPLEFGTIYLRIPVGECHNIISIITDPNNNESRGSRVIFKDKYYYVTTNFRVREQLWYRFKDDVDTRKEVLSLSDYLVDPDPSVHKLRVNSHWISSVAVSNQAMRSRVFSQMQESQRFCNYSKDKFDGELTFIFPDWVYEKEFKRLPEYTQNNILQSIKNRSNTDPSSIMWGELINMMDRCWKRNDFWFSVEKQYLDEIKSGLLPEEARDVLDKQIKTEFYLCGFLDDWFYEPPKNSPEKAGFFSLRTAQAAQGDIRNLAISLEKQMRDEFEGSNFEYQTNK